MPKISNFKIWKIYSLARSLTSCLDLKFIIMPAAKENSKKIKLFLHTTRSRTSSFHDLVNQNQTNTFPLILSWSQISFFTTSNKTNSMISCWEEYGAELKKKSRKGRLVGRTGNGNNMHTAKSTENVKVKMLWKQTKAVLPTTELVTVK